MTLQREWAEVLAQVDTMVRMEAKKAGVAIRSGRDFDGNSLETLAKNVGNRCPHRNYYLFAIAPTKTLPPRKG
jgi:hypothetical protein